MGQCNGLATVVQTQLSLPPHAEDAWSRVDSMGLVHVESYLEARVILEDLVILHHTSFSLS